MSGDFLFANRSLVVIEIIEAAHFEWAVVRAIARPDTAVVSHDVEAVLAVNGGVDRTNRFAGRVLAVLTHHRLMHHLGVLRPVAVVLVERFRAREITVDPDPMHGAAMAGLQLAYDRDVVLGLAGDHARAATGAHV